MMTLVADVQGLRKGIDLTLFEREKQSSNYILYISFSHSLMALVAYSHFSLTLSSPLFL